MEENNIFNAESDVAKKESEVTVIKKKTRKKRGCWIVLLVAILLAIFLMTGVGIGLIIGGVSKNIWNIEWGDKWEDMLSARKKENAVEVLRQQIIEDDSAVIDVVEKNSPAVVSIVITKEISNRNMLYGNPFGLFGEDFFGYNNKDENSGTQKQKVGGGSGFVVTADGLIVTNKHVVTDKSAEYAVITNDNKEYVAKFLAEDPLNDIAIIKIEGGDLPTLNLGDSDNIKIGQTVIAIGNSLGEFSNTVSKGIVSGLGRSLTASGGIGQSERLNNIIQTDAAINPGNSGGPLLNISGEVIGVNVAMAAGAQSIGFAIPANQIKKIVEQVRETGKVSTPYLGVRYVEMNQVLRKELGFAYEYGVLVVRGDRVTDFAVIPGSPADKAEIIENDIILEIDNTHIDEKNTLTDIIARHNVGDEVMLKIWHKGVVRDTKIKLEERK
jgi:S1-C subfamily serine protease